MNKQAKSDDDILFCETEALNIYIFLDTMAFFHNSYYILMKKIISRKLVTMGDREKIAYFTIVNFFPVIKIFSHGKQNFSSLKQTPFSNQEKRSLQICTFRLSYLIYVERTLSTIGVRALK